MGKSRANRAVLTDYVAMEAHQGDTLASIFKAMEVLSEFPTQVIVLKGTAAISSLRGRAKGLQRRLIDESQTSHFPAYVEHLKLAAGGHSAFQRELLESGRVATAHLERMLKDAETTGAVFADIAKQYTKEERRAVRLGEPYPKGFMEKAAAFVLSLVHQAFAAHPNVSRTPSFEEMPNTFLFRYALCIYLLALDWAANGGAPDAKPKKFRNDFIDATFAAYGTFFDGLLTADEKLSRLHGEARAWLMGLFACDLPSGLGYGNR